MTKFTAVGDYLVQRRFPGTYDGFAVLRDFIKKGDMRFFNLETTLHKGDCFAAQHSGGSWLHADPAVLEEAKGFGFNIVSFANNHTMDFSYDGLQKTLDAVNESGLPNAGVGLNLAEASAPAYLDTLAGRIALISVVSSLKPQSMAGEQSRRIIGRPGVNGLRTEERYQVTQEQMKFIKQLAEETGMNARSDISRAEGYLPELPEGCFNLKDMLFEVGEETGRITSVNEADMKRIEKTIYEAQLQADYIVVSLHAHAVQGKNKENPDDFIKDFARRSIDQGAHAVIGHGPHLLRPVEIYKGRPIFYSLGDFVLQNENIPFAPEDFYVKYGLNSDDTMHDLFKTRSDNFSRGLQTKPEMFETVIPCWEMQDGVLQKLELFPVELGFGMPRSQSGWPRPAQNLDFIRRLSDMSAPYGTDMHLDKGIVKVKVK